MIRHLKYNHRGTIDLEYNHPLYGWIPFTADPADQLGAELLTLALSGQYGQIAAYVQPDAIVVIPTIVTRLQAKIALAQAGLLDSIESLMTDPLTDIVTKIAWQDAQTFDRDSVTLQTIAMSMGLTDQQLDDLFTAAAQINV